MIFGQIDLPQPLGKPHKPATGQGEVVAHPDLQTDLPRRALERTSNPDRTFPILRALWIGESHLLLVVPQGPPSAEGDIGEVRLRRGRERLRQISGNRRWIGAIGNSDVLRRVVPG